jgi:integrase
VLAEAVKRDLLPRNVAAYAELPTNLAEGRQRHGLTVTDALRLWEALDDDRLGAAFKLMMTTTLRPGEALGVCIDAIEWDTGELTLRRAVRRERGKAVLVPNLKTVNAERRLIVPRPALEALRAQRARVAAAKLAAPRWLDPDPGLLFPAPVRADGQVVPGGPWNPRNMNRELALICERAGIPVIAPNELRHTAKALLDDDRVDPVVIRNVMGHSNEWMQDHYGNRARRAEDGHVAVMERLFAERS